MPPSVRLTSTARDHGKALINAGTDRLTSVVRSHKKSLLYVGAALALAGAGTASAATVAGSAATPLAAAPISASASAGSAPHSSPLSAAAARPASPGALTAPYVAAHPPRHTVTSHSATSHAAAAKHEGAPRAATPHAAARHVTGPRHASAAHRAAARPAAARLRHAARARNTRPYLIYDSVTPGAIPAHHVVATYATGGYAVPAAQVAGRRVLWIDTNGSDPHAAALDIEPGDATPVMAANWAREKLSAHPHGLACLYTMRSEWPAVQAAVASLPAHMRSHVRYWIADPTGYPHMVPGAAATQWYWGSSYDITTATPGF
ncbi:MAG: hypothetical protein ACLQFR_23310 [Streptosporangiaceae bacterium]